MNEKTLAELRTIFTGLVLVFSVVALLTINGTLAWLASNDEVSAEGMTVDIKTTPNLIIAKTEAELTGETMQFDVSFSEVEANDMIPVTRDEAIADTHLKYLVSNHAVDHITGNSKDNMTLEFAAVPVDDTRTYYVDYTVYIASAFHALPISSLSATIVSPESTDGYPYFNAVSVDFYVGDEVSDDNYCGTATVAGSIKDREDGTSNATIELFADGAVVPLNTEGSIKIIMRCYFDGALQDPTTGYAYINSHTVQTKGIVLGVSFTAVDAAAEE